MIDSIAADVTGIRSQILSACQQRQAARSAVTSPRTRAGSIANKMQPARQSLHHASFQPAALPTLKSPGSGSSGSGSSTGCTRQALAAFSLCGHSAAGTSHRCSSSGSYHSRQRHTAFATRGSVRHSTSSRRSVAVTATQRTARLRGQRCDLERRPRNTQLPAVDWRRYHLNIMFVSRTDTVRSRVAAGLFERIAEWNGWGRVMLPATCGIEADPNQPPDPSSTVALMSQAGLLGIRTKLFAALPEPFEPDDFYRYDIIVAVDEDVRRRVVEMAFAENPRDPDWYTNKVCSLGAFAYYCGDELTARGGSALLEKELLRVLLPVLPAARAQSDIPRPDLAAGAEEWNPMVAATLVAAAGLFRYLADEYPSDLPEYDPL